MRDGRNHVNRLLRRGLKINSHEYLRWCGGRLYSMKDEIAQTDSFRKVKNKPWEKWERPGIWGPPPFTRKIVERSVGEREK